jgi:ABC-type oligopeptide transport system ATPase subunit
MALANEPDLLIADEPTTALDVTVQAQILRLLKEVQQRTGMAMLFITHDLGIVQAIADRVCVMTDGKIVEEGLVTDVLARPQHAYTQKLLAAEPKGRANPVAIDAPVVMQADNLKVWFPIKRGLLRKTIGHIKAVDDVSLTIREGETIGVVGESGSGKTTLGLALLRLVHSEGPIVFLGKAIDALSQNALRPLSACALAADVADAAAVQAMMQELKQRFGGIDCLINNAAILRDRSLAKMSLDEWNAVIDVNLSGVFHCCKFGLEIMRDGGSVVSLGSIAGLEISGRAVGLRGSCRLFLV